MAAPYMYIYISEKVVQLSWNNHSMPFWKKNLSLFFPIYWLWFITHWYFFSSLFAAAADAFCSPIYVHAHQNDVWEYQMCDMANGKKDVCILGNERKCLVYWDAPYRTFTYYMLTLCLSSSFGVSSWAIFELNENKYTEKFVTLHGKVLNYFHVTSLLTFGISTYICIWKGCLRYALSERRKNKLIKKWKISERMRFCHFFVMKMFYEKMRLGKMKNCRIYYFRIKKHSQNWHFVFRISFFSLFRGIIGFKADKN